MHHTENRKWKDICFSSQSPGLQQSEVKAKKNGTLILFALYMYSRDDTAEDVGKACSMTCSGVSLTSEENETPFSPPEEEEEDEPPDREDLARL